MADISDVENAFVSTIAAILYPSGLGVLSYPSKIYRGFPNASQLDPDLLAGTAHITVFEQAGFSRLTGGYLDGDISLAANTSTSLPRTQMNGIRITVWAPTPAARDALTGYLDAQLSATRFIPLPDKTTARIQWRNTFSDDVPQKENLWKRDLFYTAQFSTSITVAATDMTNGTLNVTPELPNGIAMAGTVTVNI